MQFQNILLVDDDEEDQEIFITTIKEVSSSVTCTALFDAREALEKLVTKVIIPDIIFLDLNMPVMNGREFLTAIKKNRGLKNIPVIIFSTSSHSGTIRLTKELGAYDFITKPSKYDELVNILITFLRQP